MDRQGGASAVVTIGMWVLGVVVVGLLGAGAAWLVLGAVGRTARRQGDALPPPSAGWPPSEALVGPSRARYLGTTYAPSRVRRVAAHGLLGRGSVTLTVEREGLRVHIDGRSGTGGWCVPAADLRGARATDGHCGKHAGAGAVLVVDWVLGRTGLTSGFVLDPREVPEWVAGVQAVVPV
jgi:hypothetical protein